MKDKRKNAEEKRKTKNDDEEEEERRRTEHTTATIGSWRTVRHGRVNVECVEFASAKKTKTTTKRRRRRRRRGNDKYAWSPMAAIQVRAHS